jgi:PTS system mannose-specific IIB component
VLWFRIDNRLVHGQVIEAWLPHLRARTLVVANDDLAANELRQTIMGLAIPKNITFICCSVAETTITLDQLAASDVSGHILVLFASCADARHAHQSGAPFSIINLGNLHYGPGKQQVCEHIALGPEDRHCLQYFKDHGVTLDFRCLPTSTPKISV